MNIPSSGVFIKERDIILTKEVTSSPDSFKYTIKRLIHRTSKDFTNSTETITVTSDTVLVKYEVNDLPIINSIIVNGMTATSFSERISQFGNRIGVYGWGQFAVNNDTCIGIIADAGDISYKLEGLGEYYYFDGSINQYSRTLVYYKQGSQTWGEPIDFDLLTSTKEAVSTEFSAYPNPFHNTVKFEMNFANPKKVIIQDVQGRVIKEHLFSDSEFILSDFNHQGLFIYRIFENDLEVGSGKLVSY